MRPVYQVADRLKIGCKRTLSTLQWTLLSVLSGVIIGLMGIVSQETFQQSLDLKFAKKSEEVRALNRKALQAGIDYANSHR